MPWSSYVYMTPINPLRRGGGNGGRFGTLENDKVGVGGREGDFTTDLEMDANGDEATVETVGLFEAEDDFDEMEHVVDSHGRVGRVGVGGGGNKNEEEREYKKVVEEVVVEGYSRDELPRPGRTKSNAGLINPVVKGESENEGINYETH
jgi:hypothetical protein